MAATPSWLTEKTPTHWTPLHVTLLLMLNGLEI